MCVFIDPSRYAVVIAKHALTKIAKNIVKVCMEDVSTHVCRLKITVQP